MSFIIDNWQSFPQRRFKLIIKLSKVKFFLINKEKLQNLTEYYRDLIIQNNNVLHRSKSFPQGVEMFVENSVNIKGYYEMNVQYE